jgi:pterin-4a-carbinolamine dehydratase
MNDNFHSTIPNNTPIYPVDSRVNKLPIFPTERWNEVGDKLRKRFTFSNEKLLRRFVFEVLEYGEEKKHYGVITINKTIVDITVWTRTISMITEIDREYSVDVDMIYRDIVRR